MEINSRKASEWFESQEFFPAIRKSRFAKFYDYDGNRFYDFYLNQGSILLGYHPPAFSRILKNQIDLGLLSSSHQRVNAEKKILKQYPGYTHVYFFFHRPSFDTWIESSVPQESFVNLKDHTLRSHEPVSSSILVLSSAIANGFPIRAVLSKQPLSLSQDPIPSLFFEAVHHCFSEIQKGFWQKKLDTLLIPYQQKILITGTGMFEIPALTLNAEVCKHLFKKGIFIKPEQPSFYLCQQTEPQQLSYLFKTLAKESLI